MSFRFFTLVLCLAMSLLALKAEEKGAVTVKCLACHDPITSVLPKAHPSTPAGTGCTACHAPGTPGNSLGQRIHQKHLDALGLSEDTCLNCHSQDASGSISLSRKNEVAVSRGELGEFVNRFKSWKESKHLDHSHQRKGVPCLSCHQGFGPDDVDDMNRRCQACHGSYEGLAQKTAKTLPRNPHKSHFPTLACVKCHGVHSTFNDYCNKCHQTNFTWKAK